MTPCRYNHKKQVVPVTEMMTKKKTTHKIYSVIFSCYYTNSARLRNKTLTFPMNPSTSSDDDNHKKAKRREQRQDTEKTIDFWECRQENYLAKLLQLCTSLCVYVCKCMYHVCAYIFFVCVLFLVLVVSVFISPIKTTRSPTENDMDTNSEKSSFCGKQVGESACSHSNEILWKN